MITIDQARVMPKAQKHELLGKVHGLLARDKKNLDAILSGAALYYTSNAPFEAVGLLKRAAKLQSENPMIFQWLSVAAAEIRQFGDAKQASKRLIELDPKNPENWQIRGRILDSSGDPSSALTAFNKQLDLIGEQAELVFQIANCHFYLGELDKAEAGYRRTIELDPSHALALYGLSTIHKFAKEEVEGYLEQVEQAVPNNANQPQYNTSALYYGAGKALDDVKEYDRAFSFYQKANETINPDRSHNFLRPFENYKKAFSHELVQARAGWGDRSRRPIFVLGMPRSGTTLVESIIGAHPKVTTGGELPVMEDIALKTGALQRSVEEFCENVASFSRKDVGEIAQSYLRGVRAICGTDNLVTDKMPHNFMHIGIILMAFPNAKIFHCRRDPIDTCVSIYTNGMTPAHNYYKTDLSVLGKYYRSYLGLMEFWKELFPDKIVDVYYEDVVANTEINARAMIDHIALKWDDDVLTRKASADSFKTLSAFQVRQPIYQSAMGKWKRFENHLAPLIDALGDCVDGYQNQLDQLNGHG